MQILIIGGSVFLGRALTEASLRNGHAVTQLNRGRSSTVPVSGVEHLKADRDGDLSILAGKHWDAVIDTCGYYPRHVRGLLTALDGRSPHYTFVSSVSAYADLSRAGVMETDALSTPAGDEVDKVTPETYGPLKAACEQVGLNAEKIKTLIVRPGIIVGPHDPTDRFAYWVARVAAGGDVLAPGDASAPFQVIDARDLAAWIIMAVERELTGVFNTVGPREPLTLGDMLTTTAHALEAKAKFVWLPDEFLAARSADNWGALPLYLPKTMKPFAGMFAIDGRKAFGAGLAIRPLGETVADIQKWLSAREPTAPLKIGLTQSLESELLTAWKTGK